MINAKEILIFGGRDQSKFYNKAVILDVEKMDCIEIVPRPEPQPLPTKEEMAKKKAEVEKKAKKETKHVTFDIDFATENS